jgi:ParB/RepB/Spo0J family partition protein
MKKKAKTGEIREADSVPLSDAPWASLPGDPARCEGCPDRGGGEGLRTCGNPACYAARVDAFAAALRKQLEKAFGRVVESDGTDTDRYAATSGSARRVPVLVTSGAKKGRVYWTGEDAPEKEAEGAAPEAGPPLTEAGADETGDSRAAPPGGEPCRLSAGTVWTHPETGEKYDVVDAGDGDCDDCDLGEAGGARCAVQTIDRVPACMSTVTLDCRPLVMKKRVAPRTPGTAGGPDAPSAGSSVLPGNGALLLVDPDRIADSPFQVRKIDPESDDIRELAESIKANGLLEPLVLRATGPSTFELIAGHRRLTACRLAGARRVPCLLMSMGDAEAETALFVENLQRKNLTPLEEADHIARLIGRGKSTQDVAKTIGKSEKYVYRRRVMAKIAPRWREFVERRGCGPEFIERVARLPREVADKIFDAATDHPGVTRGDAAALEDVLLGLERVLDGRPWKARHPEWCEACAKRSDAAEGDLFGESDEPAGPAKCLDPECWRLKTALYVREAKTELKHLHGSVLTASSNSAYAFRAERSGANPVPVIVTDGPSAGTVRWAPKPEPAAAQKPKKLSEPDIRKACHWEAVSTTLKKIKWGAKHGRNTFAPRLETVAGLAAFYGCGAADSTGSDSAAEEYEKNHTMSDANALAALLWKGLREELAGWITAKELASPLHTAEREQLYVEALALERVLDLDPDETGRAADAIFRKVYAKTIGKG